MGRRPPRATAAAGRRPRKPFNRKAQTARDRRFPMSRPIAEALAQRRARRDPTSPLVFHRDGIPVRRWRTAWRTACQAAGVPTRFLHDCRCTAARTSSVPVSPSASPCS